MAIDPLAAVKAKACELRDLELEIDHLESRLTELNKQQAQISREQLPNLMVEVGIDEITIAAQGNQAAYTLRVEPFYSASIAAKWEPERRTEAFKYLESIDAGGLIKTEIVIAMPREDRAAAKQLVEQLAAYNPQVKENVHAGTLTAFVREQYEGGASLDLEKIGGTVGLIVKPRKKRKSERSTI